jgi:hypothetical protein
MKSWPLFWRRSNPVGMAGFSRWGPRYWCLFLYQVPAFRLFWLRIDVSEVRECGVFFLRWF